MATEAQILIDIEASGAAKTMGELETRSEKLLEALKDTEIGTAEYKKLEQQMINTNRQVKNLELSFESLDNEQIASEIGSVAGAIGDVTGAMILLGGENETLEEIAANIEKGLGVSMALKGGIEGVTSAMKLLKAANPFALILLAITLLVAGVVLLIENLDTVIAFFKELFNLYTDEEKAQQAAFEARMKREKEIAAANTKRLEDLKELRDQEREAHEERQGQFDLEIERMEAIGQSSFQLRLDKLEDLKEELKGQLEFIQNSTESWRQYYENLRAERGQSEDEFKAALKVQGIDLEDLQQQSLDLQQDIEDRIFSSESKILNAKRQQREINQAEAEKAAAEELAREEEKLAAQLEANDAYWDKLAALEETKRDALKQLRALEATQLEDEFEQRLEELAIEHEARMETIEGFTLEEDQLRLALEQEYLDQIAEIRQEAADADAAEEEKRNEERKARNQETADSLFKTGSDLIKATQQINDLAFKKDTDRIKAKKASGEKLTQAEEKRLKRQNAANKAFALAQIAIDTATAISGAITQANSVPFPANLAAMAAGVTAVIANIAAAANILGGTPEVSAGSATADAVSEAQEIQDLTGDAPPINQETGSTVFGPQQVFVLEEDITGAQSSVEVLEQQSIFG